jgi:hypothetical protein
MMHSGQYTGEMIRAMESEMDPDELELRRKMESMERTESMGSVVTETFMERNKINLKLPEIYHQMKNRMRDGKVDPLLDSSTQRIVVLTNALLKTIEEKNLDRILDALDSLAEAFRKMGKIHCDLIVNHSFAEIVTWSLIDRPAFNVLLTYIKNTKPSSVLEVGAGNGLLSLLLSLALCDTDIPVIATDIEPSAGMLFNVLRMEATEAVEHYKPGLVIIAYPPYVGKVTASKVTASNTIVSNCFAANVITSYNGPIVYIGEGPGGCCASYYFFCKLSKRDYIKTVSLPFTSTHMVIIK